MERPEFGSGGKGWVEEASDVLFAATTTAWVLDGRVLGMAWVGLTCVAGEGEVDGDLAPDAARCSDDEGDFFLRAWHGACLGFGVEDVQ